MIFFSHGGMIGRIGPFVWFNGVDLLPDTFENALETGGFCRFGSIHWQPPGGRATAWVHDLFGLS